MDCKSWQDAEMELLEPGLLYEKCIMLSSDSNHREEFLEASQLLFSRHFIDFHSQKEVSTFIKKHEQSQQHIDVPDFADTKNHPSVEQEWKLFLKVCSVAYNAEKYDLLQRLAFSAMGSRRFFFHSERAQYLKFLSLLSCLYNRDTNYGFNLARALVIHNLKRPRMLNILNMMIQTADDARYNAFLMSIVSRHPNNSSLMLLHANDCLVAGNYKSAFNEYSTAFCNYPTPLIALLLGVTLIQMACQSCTARKRFLMSQALGFFWKYQEMRGEDGFQESHYNIGRAFHQLGLFPQAIYHYNEALNFSSPLISKYPHLLDLKKESAFNLYLIYMHIGAIDIAKGYIEKYIVI